MTKLRIEDAAAALHEITADQRAAGADASDRDGLLQAMIALQLQRIADALTVIAARKPEGME